jgi:hypothetical protein
MMRGGCGRSINRARRRRRRKMIWSSDGMRKLTAAASG